MKIITTNSGALALGFIFPIICAIVIFIRFYMRRRRGVALLADDWLCLPALVCLTGVCITIIYAVEKSVLLDTDLPIEETVNAQQKAFAAVTGAIPILWLVGSASVKFSILFFYRRIFVGRVFDILSWSLVGFSGLWTIYAFFSWLLFCGRHIHANFAGPWLVCPEYGLKLQIAVYLWDALIDLGLLLLPIPFIVKLQMAAQRKFELLIAFMIGGFVLVASILNLTLQMMALIGDTFTATSTENTDLELAYFYWQTIELGVGLITCNLPTLQPLYNSILVHSWTMAVATKRSVSSWRSHYSSALSSSRKPTLDSSRKQSVPLPSSPSGMRSGAKVYDRGSKMGAGRDVEIALTDMGRDDDRRHARTESEERMV